MFTLARLRNARAFGGMPPFGCRRFFCLNWLFPLTLRGVGELKPLRAGGLLTAKELLELDIVPWVENAAILNEPN